MTPSSGLRPVVAEDRAMLERLWQLYSHDLSEFRDSAPDARGEFRAGRFPSYFDNPDACGYVVVDRDLPAGFAFVHGLTEDVRRMGDFFVVRSRRRQGLGRRTALEVIGEHPGPWEIGFQLANVGVPGFWRAIATEVAGRQWSEVTRPVPDKPHIPDDHFVLFTA